MDGGEIRIRGMIPAEFLQAAELDRIAWGATPGSRFVADGEHVWRHWMEDALALGAYGLLSSESGRDRSWEEDENLCGVALAFPALSGRMCLHKIFLHPEARGRGVGTRLLQALLEEIDRRGAVVYLTVDPRNLPARRLYARFGFKDRELIADYYGEDQDRWVMEREAGADAAKIPGEGGSV